MKTAPARRETITVKLNTRFGSIFVHVEHSGSLVHGIRIAPPQKLENSTVGEFIDELSDGITSAVKEIPALRIAQ
ncbi:MAG: hypothetical protein ACP5QR_05095 [Rhizomicrobium sp.]